MVDSSKKSSPNLIPLGHDHIVTGLFDIWRGIGRFSEVTVTGECMEPLVPNGSKVVVNPCLEQITCGDMLVFKNGDHLTIHRAIRIVSEDGKRSFLTKGDGNNYCDLPVREEFVLGKVVRISSPPEASARQTPHGEKTSRSEGR